MASIIDQLATLPLFRGITREKMTEIAGMARFNFRKYANNETIAQQGDERTGLLFLLSGCVLLETVDTDKIISITQKLQAPNMVYPEFLFGLNNKYPCSITSVGQTTTVSVSKADFMEIMRRETVFMLNTLNTLSTRAQLPLASTLACAQANATKRLAFWLQNVTHPLAEDIVVSVANTDALPTAIGISAQQYQLTIAELFDKAILTPTPTGFRITDRRAILSMASVANTFDNTPTK